MKQPIDTGFYSWEPIPLLADNGRVKMFSRKGAQRYVDKLAKNSHLPNAEGFICDCNGYWRINIGRKDKF